MKMLAVQCLGFGLMLVAASVPGALSQRRGVRYGRLVGRFLNTKNGVDGTVYVAKADTIFIENFSYDGNDSDAHFWAGATNDPDPDGTLIPDENESEDVLDRYSGNNLVLTLPDGKTIKDFKYFGVWSSKNQASLGAVSIPPDLKAPEERLIGELPTLAHSVRSGSVVIKDSKTIKINDLVYDGLGPDAFFLVGNGPRPHGQGTKVPNEFGSLGKLNGYQGQSITLTLPGQLTFYDVDWFALFCIAFNENFGNLAIPKDLDVPPNVEELQTASSEFKNCEEVFGGKMQVLWTLTNQDILFQLRGEIEDNEYMAFGLSGDQNTAQMVGGDVALAFFDVDTRFAKAVDYVLLSRAQCSVNDGVCPDVEVQGKNSVKLVAWQKKEGSLSVTYRRPHRAEDNRDLSIQPYDSQVVIAAIGPLNSKKQAAIHHQKYHTKETLRWVFGRNPPLFNCKKQPGGSPEPGTEEPKVVKSWGPFKIDDTDTFRAQIGPPGGDRGYTSITGYQSWGYSWWINNLLAPELVMVRGKTYHFLVEGGNDSNVRASYHPLYITNNPEGGGEQVLSELDTDNHKIYAGLRKDETGKWIPTAVGRLCELKPKSGVDEPDKANSFEEYRASLTEDCRSGQAGELVFTPDRDTPDLLYYQCFTHRNFGWKITVVDEHVTTTTKKPSNTCKARQGSVELCISLVTAASIFRWL